MLAKGLRETLSNYQRKSGYCEEEEKGNSMMSNFTSEIAYVRPPSVFWPSFGLCVVLTSGLTTLLVSLCIPLANFLFIQAALAALLTGGPLWWLVIVRPRRATLKRGFLVGIVGSVLAQPLMFLIATLIAAFPWPS